MLEAFQMLPILYLPQTKTLLVVGVCIDTIHGGNIADGAFIIVASDADGVTLAGQMGGCNVKRKCVTYMFKPVYLQTSFKIYA